MFSYNNPGLIEELKDDILENGKDTYIQAIVKKIDGYDVVVDYNFLLTEFDSVDAEELDIIKNTEFKLSADERIEILTMIETLDILEKQANTINPILNKQIKGKVLNYFLILTP